MIIRCMEMSKEEANILDFKDMPMHCDKCGKEITRSTLRGDLFVCDTCCKKIDSSKK